jgi:intracellular multiplication protein IcmW
MPDLSHEAAANYWYQFQDPMIYRVVTFMDAVENWTLDGNESLEEALKELGKQLDDISSIKIEDVGHESHFIKIVGNIKTSRGLRLLQAIDEVHPGSASKVLVHAEETASSFGDPSDIFLKRNIVFERLRLLSRAFSESRLKMIARALEGEE